MKLPDIEEIKREFIVQLDKASDDTRLLLSAASNSLLKNHAFVGHLFQMLDRVISLDVPTAGVCVIDGRYTLAVNPFFYGGLNTVEAKAVLTHEIYHLLNQHISRAKGLDPRLYNVSADLAINSYIEGLPTFDHEKAKQKLITEQKMSEKEALAQLPKPDKDGKCCSGLLPEHYNFPRFKTAEWYYREILKNPDLKKKFEQQTVSYLSLGDGTCNMTPEEQEQLKQDIKSGKAKITFGEGTHEKWETAQGSTDQILDEELKRMIQEAKDKAPESFGNMAGDMKQQILEFLNSKVNWKQQLRSFLQIATESIRISTRKRRSRRYGITYAGQKTDYKLNLCVFVDSSGSISDSDLSLFGGEINKIHETKMANIEIVVGDTQIQEHYKMQRRMEPKSFKVSGRGGTDAAAWIRYCNKKDFDAVVILTDGCFDYNLPKPEFMTLWALTVDGIKKDDFKRAIKFGKVIQLEKEEH